MNRSRARLLVSFICLFIAWSVASPAIPNDQPSARVDRPKISRNLTFRPTVIIRKGNSQGSGTVIVSKPGESLILTASHVARAKEKGPILVEVHRYNMGVEARLPEEGWPLSFTAELVAADPVGDVALLKVRGKPSFPYVAKLASEEDEPRRGSVVLSVGIDGGENLSSWATRVQETASFAMDSSRAGEPELLVTQPQRRFLLTAKPPAHGRSGGGLFSSSGALVGVCVGRIAMEKQKRPQGLFASVESVRKLLRENNLENVLGESGSASKRRSVTPTQAPARTP